MRAVPVGTCRWTVAGAFAATAMLMPWSVWAQTAAGPAVKSIVTTLTSSGARKECITLSPNQRLRYWYRAEGVVNFAIQQVSDKGTEYPVRKDKTAIGSGSFQPKSAQDYCMVWTNLARKPVNLSFEFARVDG